MRAAASPRLKFVLPYPCFAISYPYFRRSALPPVTSGLGQIRCLRLHGRVTADKICGGSYTTRAQSRASFTSFSKVANDNVRPPQRRNTLLCRSTEYLHAPSPNDMVEPNVSGQLRRSECLPLQGDLGVSLSERPSYMNAEDDTVVSRPLFVPSSYSLTRLPSRFGWEYVEHFQKIVLPRTFPDFNRYPWHIP